MTIQIRRSFFFNKINKELKILTFSGSLFRQVSTNSLKFLEKFPEKKNSILSDNSFNQLILKFSINFSTTKNPRNLW